MSIWMVDIKGSAGQAPFEISVLRSDDEHGKRSYGWFGHHKILISSTGGPCRDVVPKFVWDRLVAVAHAVADELNGAEPLCIVDTTKTQDAQDAARYRYLRENKYFHHEYGRLQWYLPRVFFGGDGKTLGERLDENIDMAMKEIKR